MLQTPSSMNWNGRFTEFEGLFCSSLTRTRNPLNSYLTNNEGLFVPREVTERRLEARPTAKK
jgi:hypothetical protein